MDTEAPDVQHTFTRPTSIRAPLIISAAKGFARGGGPTPTWGT